MEDNTPTPEEKKLAEQNPKCEVPAKILANKPLAPGAEKGKCDEPTVVEPDVFISPPAAESETPAQIRIPKELTVGNTEVIKTCAEDLSSQGNIGNPSYVKVAPNQVVEEVFFQDLNFSIDELQRLSSLQNLQSIVDNDLDLAGIQTFTKLSKNDSQTLLTAIVVAKSLVQQSATNLALGQLSCFFGNNQIYVSCDPAFNGTYSTVPVETSYKVVSIPENTVESTISREDANQKATRDALTTLACVYGNEEQIVECADTTLVSKNGERYLTREFILGNQSTDIRPVGVGRELVSRVVVPAGTFTGDTVEDANALALASGQQRLDCFYPSRPTKKYCHTENAVVAGWAADNQLDLTAAQNGLGGDDTVIYIKDQYSGVGSLNERPGKSVEIPVGYFTSDTSQEVADALAENQALSLLTCFWTNAEFTCACDEGFDTSLTPNPTSKVAAGTIQDFGGPVTQAELDVYCTSQLACTYCNSEILPSCLPDGYTAKPSAHVGGDVSKSLILPVVESLYNDPTLSWSLDATSGVAAKTFCFPDKAVTDSLADAAASIPARPTSGDNSAGCRYANTRQVVGCVEGTGLNGWKFNTVGGVGLSPQSSGAQVIAAGVIIVTDLETDQANAAGGTTYSPVEYANTLARNLGLSFLNCFFVNRQIQMRCFDNANNVNASGLPTPTVVTVSGKEILRYGDGRMATENGVRLPVWHEAPGSLTNVVEVASGTYISYTSRADAEVLAGSLALSVMDCYYANPKTYVYCGAKVENLGSAQVLEQAAAALPSVNSVTSGDGKIGTAPLSTGYKFNSTTPTSSSATTSTAALGNYTSGRPEDLPGLSPIKVSLKEVVVNPSPSGTPNTFRDLVHPDSSGSPSNVVIVNAGIFTSRTSFYDVVTQSVSAGIGRLDCYVKNDPTSTSCVRHSPWFEENPNPELPSILRPVDIFFEKSVTDVAMEANVVTSSTSKFEANTQAWAMTFGLLNCVYDNYQQQKLCIWNKQAYGETTNWAENDSATIGPGGVKSSESSQAAGAVAVNLARAKATCVARQGGGGGGGDASCGWRAAATGNANNPLEISLEPALVHLDTATGQAVIPVMPTLDLDPTDNDYGLPLDNNPKPTVTLADNKTYGVFMFYRSAPNYRARMVVLERTSADGVFPEVYTINLLTLPETNEKWAKVGEIKVTNGAIATEGLMCGPETLDTTQTECEPFELKFDKPDYIATTPSNPQAGQSNMWITIGSVNGVVPSNFSDTFVVDATPRLYYAQVNLGSNGDRLQVSSVELKMTTDSNIPSNAPWPAPTANSFGLPSFINLLLGRSGSSNGKLFLSHPGGKGSFNLVTIVSNLRVSGLTTTVERDIQVTRI